MKNIFFIFATTCALTFNMFAQAPEKMSYQAVIRDANSLLVQSQTIGMQISILQGSTTGTPVYVETQIPSTNINGLVSIEIGTGTIVSGIFSSIDWGNGPFYIKTETDPTGGSSYSIAGTSQLLSVPYALYAEKADPGYDSYVCLLSQSGTNIPVSAVLSNSLGITISWTRTASGKYTGTLSSPVDMFNTAVFISSPNSHTGFTCNLVNNTTIEVQAMCGIGAWCDSFWRAPLEIRVY